MHACYCALCFVIGLPPLPSPSSDTDYRIRRLYDASVRSDAKRLTAALDDIWKMLPQTDLPDGVQRSDIARDLVPLILVESPTVNLRELTIAGGNGAPVYAILIHIGLPAVPVLLEELAKSRADGDLGRRQRESAARCLVAIYDKGGGGRRMAVERIKIFAESCPAENRNLILTALKFNVLKAPQHSADHSVSK